jgi:hypothetical protein
MPVVMPETDAHACETDFVYPQYGLTVKQLAGLVVVTLRYNDGIPQGRICGKKIRITPRAIKFANIMLKKFI